MKTTTCRETMAAHFAQHGYAVVDEALDHDFALNFVAEISQGKRARPWVERRGTSSEGGQSHYDVLDGVEVARHYPWLIEWYKAIRFLIEIVTGTDLATSPHPKSAVNIKYYPGMCGCQGNHFDTNPITGLLYLSDYGAPTRLVDLGGSTIDVVPKAGRVLVLGGKRVLHGVPSGFEFARVTAPLNYYYLGHTERPDWIDRAVYENVDPRGGSTA